MAASDSAVVKAFGKAFTFHWVDYENVAGGSFQVDASAVTVASIFPASAPAASLGSASAGLKTVTLAVGSNNHLAGKVCVVACHNNGVVPAGYIGNHA